MNDIILSSLLNLFALFGAKYGFGKDKTTPLISEYLSRFYGIRNLKHYLRLYSDLSDFYCDMPTDTAAIIDGICFEPEVGEIYEGKVTRIIPIGAFVEFAPKKEGLVHISKLDTKRTEKVEDVCQVGDTMRVKYLGTDEKGRMNLSRKDAL